MRITKSQLRKIIIQEIKTSLSEGGLFFGRDESLYGATRGAVRQGMRGRAMDDVQSTLRKPIDDELLLMSNVGDQIISIDRANQIAYHAMPTLAKAIRRLNSTSMGSIRDWDEILRALFSQKTLQELQSMEVDFKRGTMSAEEIFNDLFKTANI